MVCRHNRAPGDDRVALEVTGEKPQVRINIQVGGDFTFDCGRFANRQKMRADVAFDGAFNLDIASRFDVAGDVQIRGKD